MKGIILVNINDKDVDLNDLPKEMKEKQIEEMNRRALEAIGYRRVDKKEHLQDGTSCRSK